MIFSCGPLRAKNAVEVERAQHIQFQTPTPHSRENQSIAQHIPVEIMVLRLGPPFDAAGVPSPGLGSQLFSRELLIQGRDTLAHAHRAASSFKAAAGNLEAARS